MELALIIIISFLIVYSAYKDFLSYRERDKLQMKLMSKNIGEYISSTTPEAGNTKQEVDPFLPIEDATIEQILKTKDKV